MKSRSTCNHSPLQLDAKYSSVVKSSSDISEDLRLSGMPEISKGTDSKIGKSNNFEHDEKKLSVTMKFLGWNNCRKNFLFPQTRKI